MPNYISPKTFICVRTHNSPFLLGLVRRENNLDIVVCPHKSPPGSGNGNGSATYSRESHYKLYDWIILIL